MTPTDTLINGILTEIEAQSQGKSLKMNGKYIICDTKISIFVIDIVNVTNIHFVRIDSHGCLHHIIALNQILLAPEVFLEFIFTLNLPMRVTYRTYKP